MSWDVYICASLFDTGYCVVKGEVISISAWALDVARSTVMGIPEPLRVGRVTTVSRFFCVVTQDFRAKV